MSAVATLPLLLTETAVLAVEQLVRTYNVERGLALQVVEALDSERLAGFEAWAHVHLHCRLSPADCTRFLATHYPHARVGGGRLGR